LTRCCHQQSKFFALQESSFDHLVGAAKQRYRKGDAERLGRLHIDNQLDFRRLLYRQVGGLLAVENRCSMGQLLRTKRHTATGKQSQVLVAAVNRHMPATPASGNRLRIKDAYFATVSISASQSTLAAFCRRQATPVQLLDAIIPGWP
jgi:hypothetical protein